MSDKVKIRVFIKTDKVGSECEDFIEMEREEWESMSDKDKEDICREVAFNSGEWGWEELA